MHPSIEKLLKVQEADSQLIFLRSAIRSRPLELADEAKRLEGAEARVAAIDGRIKELKLLIDQKELEIRTFDQEIEKISVAQNTAKTNEEYTIFKEQIKRQQGLRDETEEDVLQRLSEVDELTAQRGEFQGELDHVQAAYDRKAREVTEIVEGMTEQVEGLQAEREKLIAGVEKDHLLIYDRVLARHNNFAIALVDGQICQGCHMAVTHQQINELMDNGILQCKSCSRLLYLER